MLSLLFSTVVIILVIVYCNNLLEIIVTFGMIILFICLVRDWSLQEFITNFVEMFDPFIAWIEQQNIDSISKD